MVVALDVGNVVQRAVGGRYGQVCHRRQAGRVQRLGKLLQVVVAVHELLADAAD